jgi:hypothetical protein
MPTDAIIVTTFIIAVFAVFSAVLGLGILTSSK